MRSHASILASVAATVAIAAAESQRTGDVVARQRALWKEVKAAFLGPDGADYLRMAWCECVPQSYSADPFMPGFEVDRTNLRGWTGRSAATPHRSKK